MYIRLRYTHQCTVFPSLSFATVYRPLNAFWMDVVSFCAPRRPRAALPYSQILNGIFVTLTRMGATGPIAPCCRQPWRDLRVYSPVLQSVFSTSCNIATCPFSLLPLPPALACMCNSIIFPQAVSPCSLHCSLQGVPPPPSPARRDRPHETCASYQPRATMYMHNLCFA